MRIEFDSLISKLSILLCVILLAIDATIIKNRLIFFTLLVLLGVLLFYKIFIYNRNIVIIDDEENRKRNFINTTPLVAIFFIISTLELLYVYFNGYSSRGFILFLLFTIQAFIIALQILHQKSPGLSKLIILQIILLGLLIRIPIGLSVPSVIGVDPWYHEGLTYQIFKNGLIPPDTSYSGLPVFHLLMVEGMNVFGLNYVQSSYLLGSAIQVVIIATFSYLLGKRFLSSQIGLIAALIGIVTNTSVLFGIAVIPNSIGAVLWLPILYLLLAKRNIRIRAITLLLVLVLVLTHSLSSMGLFVVLLTIFLTSLFMEKMSLGKYKDLSIKILGVFPAILGALMFACWTYFSFSLYQFANSIKIGFSADIAFGYRSKFVPFAIHPTVFQEFMGNFGRILFFSLVLAGVLYLIRIRNESNELPIYSMAAITPLALGFFTFFFEKTIITGRWWYFSQILSTIVIAPFIVVVAKTISKNKWKMAVAFIVCILCFTMLIGNDVNFDNNETGGNTASRQFLNTGEIYSYKYIQKNVNEQVSVDNYYGVAFLPIREYYGPPVRSIANDLLIDQEKPSDTIWVLRDEIKTHPILLSSLDCFVHFDAITYAHSNRNISKIYDCSEVYIFK